MDVGVCMVQIKGNLPNHHKPDKIIKLTGGHKHNYVSPQKYVVHLLRMWSHYPRFIEHKLYHCPQSPRKPVFPLFSKGANIFRPCLFYLGLKGTVAQDFVRLFAGIGRSWIFSHFFLFIVASSQLFLFLPILTHPHAGRYLLSEENYEHTLNRISSFILAFLIKVYWQ